MVRNKLTQAFLTLVELFRMDLMSCVVVAHGWGTARSQGTLSYQLQLSQCIGTVQLCVARSTILLMILNQRWTAMS